MPREGEVLVLFAATIIARRCTVLEEDQNNNFQRRMDMRTCVEKVSRTVISLIKRSVMRCRCKKATQIVGRRLL
jgi:hypothetical protein